MHGHKFMYAHSPEPVPSPLKSYIKKMKKTPRISLSCKLVPVQYRGYEKPLRELIADEQDCFSGGIACWNLKKCRKLRTFAGTSRGSCASIKYSRSPIKRSSGQLCIVLIRTLFVCLMLMVNKSSCWQRSFLLIRATFFVDIQEEYL